MTYKPKQKNITKLKKYLSQYWTQNNTYNFNVKYKKK